MSHCQLLFLLYLLLFYYLIREIRSFYSQNYFIFLQQFRSHRAELCQNELFIFLTSDNQWFMTTKMKSQ